jgi:hypothetical protein
MCIYVLGFRNRSLWLIRPRRNLRVYVRFSSSLSPLCLIYVLGLTDDLVEDLQYMTLMIGTRWDILGIRLDCKGTSPSSSLDLSNQIDLVRQRYKRWSPKNYRARSSSYPLYSDTQVLQDTRIILQGSTLLEVCLILLFFLPSTSSQWSLKKRDRV